MRQEAPRLVGTRDVVIEVGDTLPDLKEGLGINDAVERVEIDTGAVDTETPGEYPIIYRYIDVEGNTHETRTTCTVTAADSPGRGSAGQQEKERQTQRQEQKSGQTEQERLATGPHLWGMGRCFWYQPFCSCSCSSGGAFLDKDQGGLMDG